MTKETNCNISPQMEDYLRIIFSLENEGIKPTVTAISKKLGVKKPTVTHALKVLENVGYINYSPYGKISITPEGKIKAYEIKKVHDLLFTFFSSILGVSAEESERESCLVEHCLSKSTVEKLAEFVENYFSKKSVD